ncbi:MAG TPA: 50S ribosomal protein L25 [Anaerolineae bacterium]|jgi:large subunit ribosomal protein L25|nr:50S ribosomal protein L25 [Anaerolineae bacterium]
MEIAELTAEKREIVGKESSKKLRREGKVPAILYSDGEATAITVNAREFSALAHSKTGTNVIIKLKIADAKAQPSAIIKEVQRNPVRDEYFHIDFQKIAMDEKITAMVPISIVGEAAGVKTGGLIEHQLWEIELAGMPSNMPSSIEVDVSELDIGDTFHVKDIQLPSGIDVLTDPSTTILIVSSPQGVRTSAEAVEGIAPEEVAGGAEAAAGEAGSE